MLRVKKQISKSPMIQSIQQVEKKELEKPKPKYFQKN
jgi:hypothetical protein